MKLAGLSMAALLVHEGICSFRMCVGEGGSPYHRWNPKANLLPFGYQALWVL